MKLIDADLIQYEPMPSAKGNGMYEDVMVAYKSQIDDLPSAQPEIIRCRDCEHWDKTWTNDWPPDYHYCPMMDGIHKGDFYCADAERRTDE